MAYDRATVLGKEDNIRIWIHYFIGDTEGNNKWLGHYQGNKSQVHHPYIDCTCSFHKLSNPYPSCVYTTMNEMKGVKLVMQDNEAVGSLDTSNYQDIQ